MSAGVLTDVLARGAADGDWKRRRKCCDTTPVAGHEQAKRARRGIRRSGCRAQLGEIRVRRVCGAAAGPSSIRCWRRASMSAA